MDPYTQQAFVFAVLLAALGLFFWGRLRYDVVALLALLAVALAGLVPPEEVFAGFANPAVVTVAAVLVVSRGLQNAGVVATLARLLGRVGHRPTAQVAALVGVVALASAFMNNVGALALLMPVAIWMARRSGRSPSLLLMPLAFGSLLGGMLTLIGTPPNLIISSFRAQAAGAPYGLFDFAWVGGGVVLAGGALVALVGWRLIPERQGQSRPEDLFQIEDYLAEVHVPESSKLVGKTLHHLEAMLDDGTEVTVVGLVRGGQRMLVPSSYELIQPGDILIVEADSDDLKALVDETQLELAETRDDEARQLGSDEVAVLEAVITPDSVLPGKTVAGLDLRRQYGVNLLALARQGRQVRERLSRVALAVGDILLLQGPRDALQDLLPALGCLPLAQRGLEFGRPRRRWLACGIFVLGLSAAALGWFPVAVIFTAVAVAMVVAGIVSLQQAYQAVDWPIVVLLGAMIPVGAALEETGGAQTIAGAILHASAALSPAWTVGLVLVATMILSDLVNNAAAAVLMAPIALRIAAGLDASPDSFLMAVAIGASCAFMTPIGHQSNTLVMAPGGYRFGDYWRMGLPLQVVIVAVAVPLLLWAWPL